MISIPEKESETIFFCYTAKPRTYMTHSIVLKGSFEGFYKAGFYKEKNFRKFENVLEAP